MCERVRECVGGKGRAGQHDEARACGARVGRGKKEKKRRRQKSVSQQETETQTWRRGMQNAAIIKQIKNGERKKKASPRPTSLEEQFFK